ncbi:Uncaracterized surface protein containing fasciclin (FAS1) repeats [Parasphingorhabdus marina DSM 22363]|uniref:Uncaracterized surface protein containing fasciclin (FAS1) repeats n=1 Tax=Parasphingorhabdus marina DSM 22363 TaxID=1123272 RepID=A0A1N6CX71_9SPHN|nr:fasciclin domain-containing protein [Parasphingorhabdus marina]SIN63161.1 Uncaracterized surface protein containing fasciclin (FAS1) repeats [Parasphingorhabdus marina DSM 22363]
MRFSPKVLFASAAIVALAACSSEAPEAAVDDTATEEAATEAPAAATIVEVAQGNENFSTLVTAVVAADLGETLSSDGPFTVFAPTNDAFEKVDGDTLSALLTPEMKDDLTGLLTYHVVAGELKAADVVQAITDGGGTATLTTVQGAPLKATLDGESVILEDAAGGKSTVIMTDVEASNGVIHAIDTVIMPG